MAFFLVARYQKKHSLCTGARETIFRAPTSRIPIPLLLLPPPVPHVHTGARARAHFYAPEKYQVSPRGERCGAHYRVIAAGEISRIEETCAGR